MMRSSATTAAGLCLLMAGAACGGGGTERPADVVVTDSAGQLHVRLGPLADVAGPPLRLEERYATDIELFRVAAGRFLPDGSLAIANSGTHQVVVLDPDGRERSRLGGPGAGPGEYRRLSALLVDRRGHLVAYDAALGRATTYGPDLARLDTRRLEPPSAIIDLLPLAILDDHRVLAIHGEIRRFVAGAVRRDSTPLLVFDEAGGRADTLGVWPAQEWKYIGFDRGVTRFELGFGRSLAVAGRNGYGAIGSTDSLDVAVIGPAGQVVMRVRGGGPNPPVDAADVERWHAELLASRWAANEALRRAVSDVPHQETHPSFAALLLDDARRLWIGAYARPGETERRWVVLDPDGAIHGTAVLPADARLLDAAGGRLALLRRTPLDEEYVQVLRTGGLDPETRRATP